MSQSAVEVRQGRPGHSITAASVTTGSSDEAATSRPTTHSLQQSGQGRHAQTGRLHHYFSSLYRLHTSHLITLHYKSHEVFRYFSFILN